MEIAGLAILLLAVAVVLFFLAREYLCWYWKINALVSLLEEQNVLLRSLTRGVGTAGVAVSVTAPGPLGGSPGAHPVDTAPPPYDPDITYDEFEDARLRCAEAGYRPDSELRLLGDADAMSRSDERGPAFPSELSTAYLRWLSSHSDTAYQEFLRKLGRVVRLLPDGTTQDLLRERYGAASGLPGFEELISQRRGA